MKRKIIVVILFIIFIFIELFMSGIIISNSINQAISIWFKNLIPSLFPFLIISKLMINYGITDIISEFTKPFISNRLNVNAHANYLIILSLISGFPASSKIIKDAYINKEISYKELEYLLSFCFFSNPLFIINIIGGFLLKNKLTAIIILFSHYLSNFILAFIFKPKIEIYERIKIDELKKQIKNKFLKSKKIGILLKDIITESLTILFILLGIITIFIFFSNFITSNININLYIKSLITGILEMTSGINSIININTSSFIKSIFIVSFLSFGGLSIHMQILAILDDIDINYKRFLIKRILACFISILIIVFIFITGKAFSINIF